MRKLTLLRNSFIVGIMLAMVSCGGDEEQVGPVADLDLTDPASVIDELKISKIIDNDEEFDFTYGSDGQLEKIVSSESETSDWGTTKEDSEVLFTYSDGKLVSVVEESVYSDTPEGGETRTYSRTRTVLYTYNANGLVSKIERIYFYRDEDGSTGEDKWSSSLEYNADNKIEKEVSASPEGDWKEWVDTEWSGENVAKQAYYYDNSPGGRIENRWRERSFSFLRHQGGKEAELEEQYMFSEFDDRLNPLVIFSVMDGTYFGQYISKNNARKIVEYDVDESGNLVADEEVTVDIVYDNNGRPTKYTLTQVDEDEEHIDEITIAYKE